MVDERVIEEVKEKFSRGMGVVEIKQQLLSKGWSDFDIGEAINKAKNKTKEENKTKREKEENKEQKNISNNNKEKKKVKKSGEFKHRNVALTLILSILTAGIYFIVWIILTTKELREKTKAAPNPHLLWLLLVPVVNIVIWFIYSWKYSKAVNEISDFSQVGLFILLIVLWPAAEAITQIKLNERS